MDELTVGHRPQAGQGFVVVVVDLEILALQIVKTLAAGEVHGEVDLRLVIFRADHQSIAPQAADLVDQGARCRPMGVVEHGLVQRPEDAVERIECGHSTSSRIPVGRSASFLLP